MSLSVRIVLIIALMAGVIGGSYWYMQITTGTVERQEEFVWRLHDNLLGVSFADEHHGWAVGQYGTIVHTTDGGRAWSYQRSSTADDLIGVYAKTSEKVWCVGQRGTVITTNNGGQTWQRRPVNLTCQLNDITFVDDREGWIVGEFETILHTTDAGSSWSLVHGGEPKEIDFSQIDENEVLGDDFGMEEEVYTLKRIYFTDRLHGWTVGEYGTILATRDGGTTWTKQKSGTVHSLTDVDFLNASFGFAVGLDGIIIKTTDGGNTWEKDKPTVVTHYFGVAFKKHGPETTKNDAVAVGQGVIASYSYYKKTYLQNWVPALEMKYSIDYNWLNRIVFIAQTGDEAVAVGDQGLILRTDNGGDEWYLVRYPEKTVDLVMNP